MQELPLARVFVFCVGLIQYPRDGKQALRIATRTDSCSLHRVVNCCRTSNFHYLGTALRTNPLRKKLQQGQPAYGAWVTLGDAGVTEAFATSGVDWLVIEMERGALDWNQVANHVRAVASTETAALIRIPESQRNFVQRAFYLGRTESFAR